MVSVTLRNRDQPHTRITFILMVVDQNVKNESYSKFYAESHFILALSQKMSPKAYIQVFKMFCDG